MSSPEASTVEAPKKPGRPLIELALGAAWLIGLSAALLILDIALGRSVVGVAVAGAVIVDLAAGWAGVRWDFGARRAYPEAARRVGAGVAIAALVVALTIAVSLAAGWASLGVGRPSLTLLLAVLRASATGVRDELLFRGIPLAACARAGVPAPLARLFAALAGAAPIALASNVSPAAIALAAGSGWLFATLWQRDRGAWSAVGAHAGWMLITGALTHGELLDLDWSIGNLTLGPRASGAPAWIAAALAVGVALLLPRLPGFRRPPPSDYGSAPESP